MKIVHLSTTTSGGAGRAAVRSVEALKLYGVEANLIDRNTELNSLKNDSPFRSLIISKTSSLITVLQSNIIQKGEELMTPLSLDTLKLNEEIIGRLKRYDVIHMHSFFNFFSIRKLHKVLPTVPKVVTLHDERLLTGGCHYATTCKGLQELCAGCPKARIIMRPVVKNSKKRELIFWKTSQTENLHLVLPSEWLHERVKRVPHFDKISTSVVNNCVPEEFFDSNVSRKNVINSKLRIGFISTELESPYKGFKFFKKAIEQFVSTQNVKVTVVLISSKHIPIESSNGVEWQQLSPKNDTDYIALLDSINVVCVPSFIDNSPNVVIEALARGIPVLASNSGGTGEIPRSISLPTFDYGNLNGFCAALLELVEMGALNLSQKKKVRELLSMKTHAENLVNVYRSVI